MESFMDMKKENSAIFNKIIVDGQEKGFFRKDINNALITTTILGTLTHFHTNRFYFEKTLGLDTEEAYEAYIANELTLHIKQTIKALLAHEN